MNTQVLFYYPNLIGYVRVILLIWSLFVQDPIRSMSIYGISCFLDALDGFAARYFDQRTFLILNTRLAFWSCFRYGDGSILYWNALGTFSHDVSQVRAIPNDVGCAGSFFPLHAHVPFIFLIFRNASLYAGKASHKHVEGNWLLMMYYTKRPVLFLVCALNETCLISLFLMQTPQISQLATIVMILTLPILVLKQVLNVLQMLQAAADLTRATVVKKKK
jgi:CDP-diacylglycerol--inositol 3-phosphatidyltransferase